MILCKVIFSVRVIPNSRFHSARQSRRNGHETEEAFDSDALCPCGILHLCVQSPPATVSRGVSQPDRSREEPADLFSEEASSAPSRSNGLNSDDDDLFAGQDTFVLTL